MTPGRKRRMARELPPQCAVDRSAGRLGRTLGRVDCVLQFLPSAIHALAGPFGGTFLLAGSQAGKHYGADSNIKRFTHKSLSNEMNCRNDSGRGGLHAGGPYLFVSDGR
jgi:hypothetical protein